MTRECGADGSSGRLTNKEQEVTAQMKIECKRERHTHTAKRERERAEQREGGVGFTVGTWLGEHDQTRVSKWTKHDKRYWLQAYLGGGPTLP